MHPVEHALDRSSTCFQVQHHKVQNPKYIYIYIKKISLKVGESDCTSHRCGGFSVPVWIKTEFDSTNVK